MKKLFNTMVFASGLTIGFTGVSQAAKIIDQLQPNIDSSSILAIGGSSEQKLAQTITVGTTGTLKGVYLPISCADGRLRIAINDVVAGAPGNVTFTDKQVRGVRVDNLITQFRYFGLPGNIAVNAGDQLAIVLENATGSCGISGSPVGDSYLAGGGFFDARPNPPGWIPFEETEVRFDLPFLLRVKTP